MHARKLATRGAHAHACVCGRSCDENDGVVVKQNLQREVQR